MNAATETPTTTTACAHHWVLGQPKAGAIQATCRKCGGERVYPAVLDDLDPRPDAEARQPTGVATAVGGARPSSVAAPVLKMGTPHAPLKGKARPPIGSGLSAGRGS